MLLEGMKDLRAFYFVYVVGIGEEGHRQAVAHVPLHKWKEICIVGCINQFGEQLVALVLAFGLSSFANFNLFKCTVLDTRATSAIGLVCRGLIVIQFLVEQ